MSVHDFELLHSNLNFFPRSFIRKAGQEFALANTSAGRRLVILGNFNNETGFEGELSELDGRPLLIAPLNAQNASALRRCVDWLNPRLLGLQTSIGMGDRIGLATPGHVRAIRAADGKVAPIFAQQSIREMKRTRRSPQEVMDDAVWGIFTEGWQAGFGADADHLKTTDDIDACLKAGFCFFTIDPGEYVENRAKTASLSTLLEMAEFLPVELRLRNSGLLGKNLDFEGHSIVFDEYTLLQSAVKYGKAIMHVATMYRHLAQSARQTPFELEVSVDETDQPTSHADHVYIAMELKRLGVKWTSLAPRFVGRFEKGVDYIGNVNNFEMDIAAHAAIARQLGPYKLSLHSGSDKFSIYPAAMRKTKGLVHLKTAGTSYLEALRTISMVDVEFFRDIYIYARDHFESDKASYHISAELDRAPQPDRINDWTGLLENFDAREILHVTFGSVLNDTDTGSGLGFRHQIVKLLEDHAETYAENLQKHFVRHLAPFLSKD
ncbi:MAG: tagaturonate epimerase family protein [Anaerolineaceae bacterium]